MAFSRTTWTSSRLKPQLWLLVELTRPDSRVQWGWKWGRGWFKHRLHTALLDAACPQRGKWKDINFVSGVFQSQSSVILSPLTTLYVATQSHLDVQLPGDGWVNHDICMAYLTILCKGLWKAVWCNGKIMVFAIKHLWILNHLCPLMSCVI